MNLSNDVGSRVVRLVFTAMMGLAWCGSSRTLAVPPTASRGIDREAIARNADRLATAIRSVEDADKALPRDTFDVHAVAQQAGNDPAKLFAFVRDQTDWIAYQGTLRGATGCLMDRLGNSLDRALLLASLLRQGGQTVRLAHAALPDGRAREVLARVRTIASGRVLPPAPPALGRSAQRQQVQTISRQYGFDPAEIARGMDKALVDADRKAEEIAQRVAEQVPALTAALGREAAKPAAADAGADLSSSDALAALQDHWWVQSAKGDAWTDFDPLLPDARAGEALTAATEIVPFDPDGKAALDAKLFHQLGVRVIVEQWAEGKLREQPVLDTVLRPADLIGQPITLRNVALDKAFDPATFAKPDALQQYRATLLSQDHWLPVVVVGKNPIHQSSFSGSGDTQANPNLGPFAGTTAALNKNAKSAGDVLDSASEPPPAEKRLTAEWVEYRILAPGRPEQTIRREIFDLVGPAARLHPPAEAPRFTDAQRLDRAFALAGEVEMLPLVGDLSQEFVSHLAAQALIANRDPLLHIAHGMSGPQEMSVKAVLEQMEKLQSLPGKLYEMALARRQCSPVRDKVYLNGLNLMTYHRFMRDSGEKRLIGVEAFDVVSNAVAVFPRSGVNPFTARLVQGIADTNTETVLAPAGRLSNVTDNPAGSTEWITIKNANDPAWERAPVPPDMRARIGADLAAGYVALVPAKPVVKGGEPVVGWWRVNPTTGEALGMGVHGWGTAMTEYIIFAVMFGVIAGTSCMAAAAADKNGATGGDAAICALIGIGVILAVIVAGATGGAAAGLAVGLTGAGGVVGALASGLGMNTDIRH